MPMHATAEASDKTDNNQCISRTAMVHAALTKYSKTLSKHFNRQLF